MRQEDALYDQGNEFGDNAALLDAITACNDALRLAPRERAPLDWAMTQNNLGTAFSTLGERESGTAPLEQAVAAYRAALEERTRNRLPLKWAATQFNLANTLETLAERTHDKARMAEALGCMRGAAEVYQEASDEYRRPIAEQRAAEIEAALAAMQGK
jgi:tetratricopeptide (TPR) repeat protein